MELAVSKIIKKFVKPVLIEHYSINKKKLPIQIKAYKRQMSYFAWTPKQWPDIVDLFLYSALW